jgi:hypothetical protein
MKRVLGVALMVVVCALAAFAQFPNTGFPPFGSFENGKFDSVNRQNLNIHFEIPVVSVPGRGMNFSFAIVYDSTNWTIAGSPATWTPIDDDASDHTGWGWKLTPSLGAISEQITSHSTKCFDDPQNPGYREWVPIATYYYAYRDASGTYHNLSATSTENMCTGATSNTFPGYATDGSGYKIISESTVISPSGITINPTSGMTDSNGNQISAIAINSSETDWKDTAGRIALKVIKSSNAIDYKYQDINGDYQTIHLVLQSLPIRTNFGCAVGESGGTASVPAEIDLPNGRKYTFAYEATPGYPGTGQGAFRR